MEQKLLTIFLLFIVSLSFTNKVTAAPDSDASRISLKIKCDTGNNNCFDTDSSTTQNGSFSEMLDWIWDTRAPSEQSPLAIDIDPGTYAVPSHRPFCDQQGHITLNGAGEENTVFVGGGAVNSGPHGNEPLPVLFFKNCGNIVVKDLTVRSDVRIGGGNSVGGVHWNGAGSSTWSNVRIEGATYGWYDTCGSGASLGTHYWFDARLDSVTSATQGANIGSVAYYSRCGDNWLYSSEIRARQDVGNGFDTVGALANGNENSNTSIRIFGSAVRVGSVSGASNSGFSQYANAFGGLLAAYGASVHMHGGIVSVNSQVLSDVDIFGAYVFSTGNTIHTPGTAFALVPGSSGSVMRIRGEGTPLAQLILGPNVQSPFLWSRGINPPEIQSAQGADLFIEIDCLDDGNCDPTSTQVLDSTLAKRPHLMIYDATCENESSGILPWFDSTRGKCRGEP